jgi:transcriptional regulator with XRE-family HTH domain
VGNSSCFRHDGRVSERGDREALARLAAAVRKRRGQAGLTQEAAAHEAGISVRHYQTLEGGALNVSYLVLKAVASALGTTVAELADSAERSRAAPHRRRAVRLFVTLIGTPRMRRLRYSSARRRYFG